MTSGLNTSLSWQWCFKNNVNMGNVQQNGSSTKAHPPGWDLRKGRITKPHSPGAPVNIAETIIGHSAGNVYEPYVHKGSISMKTLQEGLDRLKYDAVVAKLLPDR
jgi:hypothetical protein